MAHNSSQSTDEAKKPSGNRLIWRHIIVYLCIWFLIVALILVYFTITGSPQAGLLEIGISTLIFVFSFYFIIKFFPSISKIFSLVIVTGFGIALVYMNYHFLKIVKKDASFEQLLVGDLLTNKIVKSIKRQSIALEAEEGISQINQKYEKSLQAISLDQLKKPVSNFTIAEPELSSLKPPALSMRAEPSFVVEKYKIDVPVIGNISTGIHGLGFTKNGKPMILERPDNNSHILSSHFNPIREASNMILNIHKIHLSLSEDHIGTIPVMNLSRPLKEGRILID